MRRTGQEAVELHQELEVDIVALGGLAVRALDVVAVEIDTWTGKPRQPFGVPVCSKCGSSDLAKQDGAPRRKERRIMGEEGEPEEGGKESLSSAEQMKSLPLPFPFLSPIILFPHSHTKAGGGWRHVPMAAVVVVVAGGGWRCDLLRAGGGAADQSYWEKFQGFA